MVQQIIIVSSFLWSLLSCSPTQNQQVLPNSSEEVTSEPPSNRPHLNDNASKSFRTIQQRLAELKAIEPNSLTKEAKEDLIKELINNVDKIHDPAELREIKTQVLELLKEKNQKVISQSEAAEGSLQIKPTLIQRLSHVLPTWKKKEKGSVLTPEVLAETNETAQGILAQAPSERKTIIAALEKLSDTAEGRVEKFERYLAEKYPRVSRWYIRTKNLSERIIITIFVFLLLGLL